MDFTWLVTWSGFKRFWRKRIYRLKNCLLIIITFYNKNHQQSIARSSSGSCWDHFSFLFASHLIWTDDTYFLFLNFFYLFLIRELLMCPFFYSFLFLFFYRSLILNWISTCWWSLFRVFLKEIFYFSGSKRVQWNFIDVSGWTNMAIYHFELWLLDF